MLWYARTPVETACLLMIRYHPEVTSWGRHTDYEAWHRRGCGIQCTRVINRVVVWGYFFITRVGYSGGVVYTVICHIRYCCGTTPYRVPARKNRGQNRKRSQSKFSSFPQHQGRSSDRWQWKRDVAWKSLNCKDTRQKIYVPLAMSTNLGGKSFKLF